MTTFLLNYWPKLLSEFIKIKFVFLKHQDKKIPLFVKYYLNAIRMGIKMTFFLLSCLTNRSWGQF